MDPLSDVLRVVRLTGAFFYNVEAASPWCVEAPPAGDLVPRVLPDAEHLIPYHILTEGRCFGGLVDEPPVEMHAGDIIVFPQGDAHRMGHSPTARDSAVDGTRPERYLDTVQLGRGTPDARFVCGFFGVDRRPFNPLLAALPRRLHLSGLDRGWVGAFAAQVMAETRSGRVGSESVLTRLAELMFVEVLRKYVEELQPGQTGWLAGLNDPVVGQALLLLHARPAHPWTLQELAEASAASRSTLAERFTQLLGEPPMQYLTRWRMQVASGLLLHTGAKVAAVASDVGYESEAAFSRAFKKVVGEPPAAWRARRAR